MSALKHPTSSLGPLMATWALLLGVDLVACWNWLSVVGDTSWVLLLIALHAISCLAITVGFITGMRPMLLFVSIFAYAWITVPATYQLALRDFAWSDLGLIGLTGSITEALILLTLSAFLFLLGYIFSPSRVHKIDGTPQSGYESGSSSRLLLLATVLCGLGAVLIPVVASAVGGIDVLFSSRAQFSSAVSSYSSSSSDKSLQGVLTLFPGAVATSASVLAVSSMHRARRQGLRIGPSHVFVLLVALALLWTFSNPFANTRFIFAASVGAFLLAMIRPRSAYAGALTALLSIIGLFFIYPLLNFFRSGQYSAEASGFRLASGDFDGFQQAVNTMYYVDANGFSYGWHIISAVFFFVPRSLWESKANPASFEIAAFRGYIHQNLSLPTPSELFMDFGWLGASVLFVSAGYLWRRLDDNWMVGRDSVVVVVSVLAAAQIGLFRGPLGSQAPVVAASVMIAALGVRALQDGRGKTAHGGLEVRDLRPSSQVHTPPKRRL